MSYKQICKPPFTLQFTHQVQHLSSYRYIKRAYRLICDYEFRLHYKCPCYTYALPLSAGKLMREAACKFRQQANIQQRFIDQLCTLLSGQVLSCAVCTLRNNVINFSTLVKACHGVLKYHLNFRYNLLIEFWRNFTVYTLAFICYCSGAGWMDSHYGAAYRCFTRT